MELADLVKVASGTISMIETGATTVSAPVVSELAKHLGCSTSYLLNERPEPTASYPLLRAYADAPKRVVDAAIADAITAVVAVRDLDLKVVINSLPAFAGDLNDEDEIEQFAGEVRTRAGIGATDVVEGSIRSAERLGCVVLPLESELGRHLGLSSRIDGMPVIRVSKSSRERVEGVPGDRQRFTIAHELGHLTLHHDRAKPSNPEEAARAEREANRFASAFLAPGDAILEDLDSLGGRVTLNTLATLKSKWGFAIKAFVVRFRNLNMIDDDQARSLYKQISARKWNTTEPVFVAGESAVWLRRALEKKFGSDNANQIASIQADLDRTYFFEWTDWETRATPDVVSLDDARARRDARPRK